MATQKTIDQAIKMFGSSVVYQAIELVEFSDPDGAYTTCDETGQFDIAEAIEFLYFDDETED